ncbi:T-complex protein 1 subunit alpha [Phytophthora fragariae]|uniref:T-complex protein 1 subunit alpha n=1 Tax=Phytophthora fragariae TaxID=53985 RepID=A0A6A4AH09_9STRA|nr:T-complex protein 1 subunit alpha [Phytophthora fragariae]KAE8940955.1 T-complex protein 1 subunit alpha [Phytophthora fragariae]KAE9127264.1 T-complex protein 1 subunit alpha [Phytophthora fragariae]KAE9129138.1 T-complex protein 1 subunit alpha [Phytophthora fragariae]KAE9150536.1 T-complex protein 1 subunit alpha [Phytophthora fragariae]
METADLVVDGTRTSGKDVRELNVTAAVAIANIVKSSLGPVGLDKMLVDDIGDVTITNDGATILKQLEVEQPAGKVLVELAGLQDQEVGDGTTSVVIIAAELLKRANELVKNKIHPTSVIAGYRLAMREAVKYIKENLSVPVDSLGRESLVNAAKTSMSSKILGPESDFFANLVVDAVSSVKVEQEGVKGKVKARYPVSSINVLKAHGKSALETQLVDGFALNCTKASQQMPTYIKNAKIALLDFDLQRHRMQMGVQVVVNDPNELELIRQREIDITKEKIQKMIDAGANVILTTKGIDDLCLKYFVENGCMGVRRCKKEDLQRIAKATGGQVVLTLADMEGEETFDPLTLGEAQEVSEERVGDGELIYIKGCKTRQATTVVLRGANENMLDEMDRSMHDSFMVVKRMLESNQLVAGGGAVEAALSIYLENFATTLGSREQLAIAEFADALLVIPKTLAVNAAKDASELVARLRAHHNTSQSDATKSDLRFSGLDLLEGTVRNSLEAGVVEPAISKIKSLRFATEAAITILRIDDLIKLNPKEEPQQ